MKHKKNSIKIHYPGWELKNYDKSNNFRNYQLSLIKKYLKGKFAEVGPGNVLQGLVRKIDRSVETYSGNPAF